MKSKKSCFNKIIFLKNIKMSWPLWGLYLMGLLLFQPLLMLFKFRGQNAEGLAKRDLLSGQLSLVHDAIDPHLILPAIFILSLLFAVFYFFYLTSPRNAHMIHSLPIRRKELFVTNIVTGIVALIGPAFLSFIFMTIVCIAYHVGVMYLLLLWFLMTVAFSILFYSIAVFCVFLSGHWMAVLFFYAFINCLYEIFRYMFAFLFDFFGYGLSTDQILSDGGQFSFLSPLLFLWGRMDVAEQLVRFRDFEQISGLDFVGMKLPFLYLTVAFIFYLLSWVLYRRRKIEYAGDMVAVGFVRPLIRWMAGILVGFVGGYLVVLFFQMTNLFLSPRMYLFFSLLTGTVGFVAAQMVIEKSFRVFKKRMFIELFGCLCLLVVVFIGARGIAFAIDQKVPAADDVEDVAIYMNYENYLEAKADIEAVRDIHRQLIHERKRIYDRNKAKIYELYEDMANVRIRYTLKNGRTLERNYLVMENAVSAPILQKINTLEMRPENFINDQLHLGDKSYPNGFELTRVMREIYNKSEDFFSQTIITDDSAKMKSLLQAVVQDAEEGTLQKYSLQKWYGSNRNKQEETEKTHVYEPLIFEILVNASDEGGETSYSYYNTVSVEFGTDCRHIVEKLIELGVVESGQDFNLWKDEPGADKL